MVMRSSGAVKGRTLINILVLQCWHMSDMKPLVVVTKAILPNAACIQA